jgi:hypothetical protein
MQRSKLVLALMLVVSFGKPVTAQKKHFIDWNGLKNPVLSYPNWSVKDTAMVYRNGTFYIFFSSFYPDRGQVRSHVVEVSTPDFKHYPEPFSILTVRKTVGSACAHPMYSGCTGNT